MVKKDFSNTSNNNSPLNSYFQKSNVEIEESNKKNILNTNIAENKVEKKGKMISARVNEKSWEDFKQLAKKLNYSANELLNIVIDEVNLNNIK